MSKRWKPNNSYYYVDSIGEIGSRFLYDDALDVVHYEYGNCFETREQAEAAAAKVKELLLSMAGEVGTSSTQLPKLTAEVFDRPDCPEWAHWAAVDQSGYAYWFETEPVEGELQTDRTGAWGSHDNKTIIPGLWDSSDWLYSLIERPAPKLPDWCKDGALAWEDGDYFKLEVIDANHRVTMMYSDGTEESVDPDYIVKHVKPARPRPYNAEEMQKLVGKVLELYGNRDLVTSYDEDGELVYADSMWMNADELLSNGYTIDGELCCVLEHLENGEWVE